MPSKKSKLIAPDELAAMGVFAQIVERGSLSAAADGLSLSKSFVSKTLRSLEEGLATRLLCRTTRRQTVTEAGHAYYEGCKAAIEAAGRARSAVERLQSAPVGIVRVSVPVNFGNQYVAPLLPKLLATNPQLNVEMVLSDRVVDLIGDGFDLALRIVDTLDEQLVARPIATIRWVTCASPGYLHRRGIPRRPEALQHHDCLTHPQLAPTGGWRFMLDGQLQQVAVRGPMRTNNSLALMNAAIDGLGIARVPTFLAGAALRDGHLQSILDEFMPAPQIGYAVFPTGLHLAPKVRCLVNCLKEAFGGAECDPPWDAWRQRLH